VQDYLNRNGMFDLVRILLIDKHIVKYLHNQIKSSIFDEIILRAFKFFRVFAVFFLILILVAGRSAWSSLFFRRYAC